MANPKPCVLRKPGLNRNWCFFRAFSVFCVAWMKLPTDIILQVDRMKTKPADVPSSNRPPVDFAKQWTNGHKCFTSAESRAHVELLHTEERTRNRYDVIKTEFAKPRNPLNGEVTPRDVRGEAVMNPAKLNTVKGGILLFPPDRDLSSSQALVSQRSPKPTTAKIGVGAGKYDILGNVDNRDSGPEDLFQTVRISTEEKQKRTQELQKKNDFIAMEKAKRYQKDLEREMILLKRQMEEKEKEMAIVQKQFLSKP